MSYYAPLIIILVWLSPLSALATGYVKHLVSKAPFEDGSGTGNFLKSPTKVSHVFSSAKVYFKSAMYGPFCAAILLVVFFVRGLILLAEMIYQEDLNSATSSVSGDNLNAYRKGGGKNGRV